jgi:hypothetical protein
LALAFEKGVFTANTSTGNQTISLIDTGFGTVKAILLWTSALTSESDSNANAWWSHGVGTYRGSVVQQYAISAYEGDVSGTTVTAGGSRVSSILRLYSSGTPAVDADAALVSLGSAQFVVNWTDAPGSAIKVHYVALGGSDITDAIVNAIDLTNGTGDQDFTLVAGFGKPDLCLSLGSNNSTSDTDSSFWNPIFLGVGKSDSEQFISSFHNSDNEADVALASYQKSGTLMAYASTASVYVDAGLAAKASWPTDGVRITKSAAAIGGTSRYGLLSLRGSFTSVLGSGTAPTAAPTVDQDLPVGATPRGAIFVHNSIAATSSLDTTHADLGTWGIGAMDGTREGWAGLGDDDAAAVSNTHAHHSESKAIKMFSPSGGSGTLESEADSSFSGNNVRLSWADTDSVAREYRYVLFGDATAAAAPPSRHRKRSYHKLLVR